MAELISRKHIANRKAMEEYECFICYELTQDMRKCKGPCGKPYCFKCIGRIKYNNDCCPSKCSKPFVTQPIINLKLQYQCPYHPENCKELFYSAKDFQRHCEECPFKTAQGLKEISDKKLFQCCKGHKLQLVTASVLKELSKNEQNFYTLVMNDLCCGCGGRNLCRSICVPCSKQSRYVYCVDCRQYPFTKKTCPMKHQYIQTLLNSIYNYGNVCDRCGISGSLMGEVGYSDYNCDIFLCKICYQIIPEPLEQQIAKEEPKVLQKVQKQQPDNSQS